jgi:hypothetical protein
MTNVGRAAIDLFDGIPLVLVKCEESLGTYCLLSCNISLLSLVISHLASGAFIVVVI